MKCVFSIFSEGMEEPIVGVTKAGFSLADVSIMEGQSVIFVWQDRSEAADIVQVGQHIISLLPSRNFP